MTLTKTAACLALALALHAPAAAAQYCATPSPLLTEIRQRALEQLPASRRPALAVDLGATAGRAAGAFADAAVGYVVADHFVRRLAPMALERAGHRAFAARLRALAPVTDRQSAFRAQDEAEDVANTIARRSGRVRWSTPAGAALEVTVEGAALAGYAAAPGAFPRQRYVTTIASGLGAADRVGIAARTLAGFAQGMLLAARDVARCAE